MKSWLITWIGFGAAIATALCNAAVPGAMNFKTPAGIEKLTANMGTSATNPIPNPNSALLAPLKKR